MGCHDLDRIRRPVLLAIAVALLGTPIAFPASALGRAEREDRETCSRMGAAEGSRDHMQCMLAQQRRRDVAPLRAAEQQRINAEVAQNNLEMVRRIRCERAAKRDAEGGVRPRRC